MKPAHPERSARPLLVVGWDGATPELIGPWMDDATLPALRRLRDSGAFAPLRSVLPPLSPAAWTSAFTGLNPGRHGIWDFGHRAEGTYQVVDTDASHRSGAALWEIAELAGLRWLAVNVPLSHPAPQPARGVFVPGLGASRLAGATWPRSLVDEVPQLAPDHVIDVNAFEHRDPAAFLDAAWRMIEGRAQLAEALIRREQPDLAVVTFVVSDRVQHAFWAQTALPGAEEQRAGWRFAHAVRDTFVRLDRALQRLIDAAGPEVTTVVVSDHGFGELEGDLYLNAVLEDAGLLSVRRPAALPPLGRLSAELLATGRPGTGKLSRALERVDEALGRMLPGDEADFGDIRWEATRAYSRGLLGNIWLNLRGREPLGQIEPGPEAEATLEQIEGLLATLVEPETGEPLIQAVFRGAELFDGERAAEAPDLIVVPRDYRWMTRAGREIGPRGQLCTPAAVAHTGNHRLDGVFVGAGPGIHQGRRPDLLRLLDLTPTALALLGVEVPRGLDGVPMQDVLSCGLAWTDELPDGPHRAAGEGGGLAQRLRGLGYLGS